jgi:hypothetical protein
VKSEIIDSNLFISNLSGRTVCARAYYHPYISAKAAQNTFAYGSCALNGINLLLLVNVRIKRNSYYGFTSVLQNLYFCTFIITFELRFGFYTLLLLSLQILICSFKGISLSAESDNGALPP